MPYLIFRGGESVVGVFSVSRVTGGEKENNSASVFVTCYLTASMISISFFRRAFTRSDNSTPFASALAVR